MDIFNLKENKTDVFAGFATFLAMLYIIPVNVYILSTTGMLYGALVSATIAMTVFCLCT